jgi:hypothetical protein
MSRKTKGQTLALRLAQRMNRWSIEALARLVGAPIPHSVTEKAAMLNRLAYMGGPKDGVSVEEPKVSDPKQMELSDSTTYKSSEPIPDSTTKQASAEPNELDSLLDDLG